MRLVSLWLDQDPHRGATLSGYSDVRPIRALSGLSRLVLGIGGRGLSPNRTVSGITDLLKIKSHLRRKAK